MINRKKELLKKNQLNQQFEISVKFFLICILYFTFTIWSSHSKLNFIQSRQQVHRIVQVIRYSLETKKFCPTVFLEPRQAFHKIWIEGLLHKISRYLPPHYVRIFQWYFTNRTFRIYYNEAISPKYNTTIEVPQSSVLGPIRYLLYTADLPKPENVIIITFADDKAALTPYQDQNVAVTNLQKAVDKVIKWSTSWRIKLNREKSIRVDFTVTQ